MDLKKIDLNKLQDYAFTQNEIAKSQMTSGNKFINIKCLVNESIIPTVQAIPLEELQAMREDVYNMVDDSLVFGIVMNEHIGYEEKTNKICDLYREIVVKIIDKYIEKAKQS